MAKFYVSDITNSKLKIFDSAKKRNAFLENEMNWHKIESHKAKTMIVKCLVSNQFVGEIDYTQESISDILHYIEMEVVLRDFKSFSEWNSDGDVYECI